MEIDEALKLIERITYKPEVKVSADRSVLMDILHISFSRLALDSENPENTERKFVSSFHSVRADDLEIMDQLELLARIRRFLLDFETHEMNEWLRFDGQRLVDPHPELAEQLAGA